MLFGKKGLLSSLLQDSFLGSRPLLGFCSFSPAQLLFTAGYSRYLAAALSGSPNGLLSDGVFYLSACGPLFSRTLFLRLTGDLSPSCVVLPRMQKFQEEKETTFVLLRFFSSLFFVENKKKKSQNLQRGGKSRSPYRYSHESMFAPLY